MNEEEGTDVIEDNGEVIDSAAQAENAQPVKEEAPAPASAPEEDEDVAEARLFGWKSPDEWQGERPPGYIDNAKDYLARVERSRVFQAMQQKLTETERASAEVTRKLEAMTRRALEDQQEKHKQELEALSRQQRKAAEDGDFTEYDRLEARRGEMKPPQDAKPEQTPDAPQEHPDVTAYRASEKGAWLKNPRLARDAMEIVQGNPEVLAKTPKEQIAYAEKEIRKMYPAYFPAAEKKAPPRQTVDGGGMASGTPAGGGGGGEFAKLPASAKAHFKQFVERGIYADNKEAREEYAADYNDS